YSLLKREGNFGLQLRSAINRWVSTAEATHISFLLLQPKSRSTLKYRQRSSLLESGLGIYSPM
ncbi:MAG: hypothetical protein ACK466_08915, partial [Pseudanabaena sp.]